MPQRQREAAENLSLLFLDRHPGPGHRWALEWCQDSDLKNSYGFCGPTTAPFPGNLTWSSEGNDQKVAIVVFTIKLNSWRLSVDTWPTEPCASSGGRGELLKKNHPVTTHHRKYYICNPVPFEYRQRYWISSWYVACRAAKLTKVLPLVTA